METLKAFLNGLTPIRSETWQQLELLFSEVQLPKGRFFLEDGRKATQIGFLTDGVMRAFYRNREGVEYNKHFFVPGSFIGGYASLITGKPNQIWQQSLTDCRLLVTDFASFSALYDTAPDLERAARLLAERFFVQKEEREIELVLSDAQTRYELFQQQFPGLEQRIPQYHIASYLGVTPTQLSRIRRKMARR
ncbi:Crp/Fnr family transcriptional regulator [Larkinella rosea]|uniref:Crp/Fnr family transcriptional regulator n=1 Tax=Larkinella rosea TaxID=2025312 RepID=A0A3P1B963_9BACT|nr:Crp/Fnr family transcriptional regulator [Larkinella rosea]RRA97558.1 Crp/Fnr family transcriptional regulator [Larkinella rosea]